MENGVLQKMLTLKKKIEQRKNRKEGHSDGRISVRDKLLVRGAFYVAQYVFVY